MRLTLDQKVIFAARSGNVGLLRERLEAGGNPNVIDERHGCALAEAIRGGHLEAIDALLEHGADPNLRLGDAWGPLEVALRNPDPETVCRLVCAGAKLRRRARPHYAERLEDCLIAVGRRDAIER